MVRHLPGSTTTRPQVPIPWIAPGRWCSHLHPKRYSNLMYCRLVASPVRCVAVRVVAPLDLCFAAASIHATTQDARGPPTNVAQTAVSEDRTHDLRIMRPTRCQLRYDRHAQIASCVLIALAIGSSTLPPAAYSPRPGGMYPAIARGRLHACTGLSPPEHLAQVPLVRIIRNSERTDEHD